VYNVVNRDVPGHCESAGRETDMLYSTGDRAERCVTKGSATDHGCCTSTQDALTPDRVISHSDRGLSAESVKKLKRLHRGNCHKSDVRWLCATIMALT